MMAGDLEVKLNQRQLDDVIATLRAIPRGFERVASRAINKTATTVRSRTVKAISRGSGIKQKTVRQKTILRKAGYKKLSATISILRKGIPMMDLSARQTKKGVTFRNAWQGGKRQKLRHAFISTMSSGHKGVFERMGTGRLPIRELFAPSIATLFERLSAGRILVQSTRDASQLLTKNLATQIDLLLKKRRAA